MIFCIKSRNKSLAKIPKTLYDGRVRKVLVFIMAIFLYFLATLFAGNKVYAACQINIQPSSVPRNFNDTIIVTNSSDCFSLGTPYQVVAYPQSIPSLEETYKMVQGNLQQPVTSDKVISPDKKTLTVNLNFNAIITRLGSGSWNFLVCLPKEVDSKNCDKNPVARSNIMITQLASIPTPTPQIDQPIIDPLKQSQCTFQYTEDKNLSIPIVVENIDNQAIYHSWWEGNGDLAKEILPDPTQDTFEAIIWGDTIKKLGKPTDPKGHLFCVDKKGKKRTGANCIRLFFKTYQPKGQINTSCSQSNAGDSTYDLTSSLSPCSQWTLLDGTTISPKDPRYNDPDFKERKCIAVNTAIGDIRTNPAEFVKSIFSIVMGLAGGIALILIIISGYKMMASQGNPEALTAAREQLTSAIIGLLFIIFSFVILQVIGVDILRIPGFQP